MGTSLAPLHSSVLDWLRGQTLGETGQEAWVLLPLLLCGLGQHTLLGKEEPPGLQDTVVG